MNLSSQLFNKEFFTEVSQVPGPLPKKSNSTTEKIQSKFPETIKKSNEEFSQLESVQQNMNKYDGGAWYCTKMEKNARGGYILTQNLRGELEPRAGSSVNLLKKVLEIFPAVEVTYRVTSSDDQFQRLHETTNVLGLIPMNPEQPLPRNSSDFSGENQFKGSKDLKEALEVLGFSHTINSEGVITIKFPNREALIGNWEHLRKQDPRLPEFHLAKSEGIAGHLDFVEANLTIGPVASDGRETHHDMIFHVLNTIRLIYSEENPDKRSEVYFKERERIQKIALPILNQLKNPRVGIEIEDLEISKMIFGAIIDYWSGSSQYGSLESEEFISGTARSFNKKLFANPYKVIMDFKPLFDKEFPEKSIDELVRVWKRTVHGISDDPRDRSIELTQIGDMDEAIKVAETISDGLDKEVALRNIFKELQKKGDVDKAIEVLKTISDGFRLAGALGEMSKELIQGGNIDDAIKVANMIPNALEKGGAFRGISKELIKSGNIDKAIEVINKIPVGHKRKIALLEVYKELQDKGCNDKAKEVANIIADGLQRKVTLLGKSKELTRRGRDDNLKDVAEEVLNNFAKNPDAFLRSKPDLVAI